MSSAVGNVFAAAGAAILLADYLERQGLQREQLLGNVGLTTGSLTPESRIPRAANLRLWQLAEQHTADPALGIHIAQFAQPGTLGLVEYLARTANTLTDAVTQVERFTRLTHDAIKVEVNVRPDTVDLVHRTADGQPQPAAAVDFVSAYIIGIARELAGFSFGLQLVELAREPPADPGEWQRFFRCPLTFGAAANRFRVDRTLADRELQHADPRLHRLLQSQAEMLHADMPPLADDNFVAHVQSAVRETLLTQAGQSGAVARRLGVSERTLRRRLAHAGVTYRNLRDSVRRTLALELEGSAPQAEIAAELGFASTSAYRRAFERWAGMSPRAWLKSR